MIPAALYWGLLAGFALQYLASSFLPYCDCAFKPTLHRGTLDLCSTGLHYGGAGLVISIWIAGEPDSAITNVLGAFGMLIGAYFFHQAWLHSKNRRKKLKDKILGRVKVFAGGLKIVPEGT